MILFGSHARGDPGPDSDLDFLVIEAEVPDVLDEAVRLRRCLRGLGVPADVIVVSTREVDSWCNVRGSFLARALAEGRRLDEDG